MWSELVVKLLFCKFQVSRPSTRSSACRTCRQRKCATALPPLTAACWIRPPRPPPPWRPRRPPPPLTRSRLSPCLSPPNRRDERTTRTSPCQGKPRVPVPPPPPLLLPLIPASLSTASRQPSSLAPSPSPPCPRLCSPRPHLSTRQLYIPIMPCCRHNLSPWSPNQWSDLKTNVTNKLFTAVYCLFYLFIDIRPSFYDRMKRNNYWSIFDHPSILLRLFETKMYFLYIALRLPFPTWFSNVATCIKDICIKVSFPFF